MTDHVRRARRPVLVMLGFASLLGAGSALWAWLSPESISDARTVTLLCVLGLFVLPVLTLAALEYEHRRTWQAGAWDGSEEGAADDDASSRLAHSAGRRVPALSRPARSGQERPAASLACEPRESDLPVSGRPGR